MPTVMLFMLYLELTDKAQVKAVDIIIGDISDDLKKQTNAITFRLKLKLLVDQLSTSH